jgi:GTP pyrophosphokinase
MITIAKIIEKAQSFDPKLDKELLNRAYDYASKLHSGQYRLSGDPYISHSLAVVEILLNFRPDENSIVATLLHGLPELAVYKPDEIRKLFGEDVFHLVSAMEMLNKMKAVDHKTEVESLRKMFLAMAKDIRVVMIKLADRLQNMQTLDFHSAAKRKIIAKETMDIYVPISARMGIYSIKTQLEDLCFKYLYSRQYEVLNIQMNEYMVRRGKNIGEIKKELEFCLQEHGIKAEVEGRIKNLYSIYKKLKMKDHSTMEDIYDIFAIRIILPTKLNKQGVEQTDHLYGILGLIHSKWKPLVNRFKDYVAVPKPNGYQSLHTAVLGLAPNQFNQVTEIQIRSKQMHEAAEYGIASHWLYEDIKKTLGSYKKDRFQHAISEKKDAKLGKYVGWLDALSKIQRDIKSGSEFMEALKLDVFNDRIFALTPNGEVKDLPSDATPVDFAYAVHTDIGHRCLLAKVNGSVVPLDYKLKNGEVVEIISGTKPHPKLHWLAFVKTAGAKAKIKSYFRGFDKDRSLREGREMINKFLVRVGKPLLDDDLNLFKEYGGKRLSLKDRVALVEEIGNGSVPVPPVLKKIFGRGLAISGVSQTTVADLSKISLPKRKTSKVADKDGIYIAGQSGLPYRFAQCCKPAQNNPIIAYVTRGSAVAIHQENCKVLREADQQRIVEASWGQESEVRRFPVKVAIRARDRVGLIRDIADVISSYNVNILDFGKEEQLDKDIQRELVLEIADNEQFLAMLEKLQRIRNMLQVEKVD